MGAIKDLEIEYMSNKVDIDGTLLSRYDFLDKIKKYDEVIYHTVSGCTDQDFKKMILEPEYFMAKVEETESFLTESFNVYDSEVEKKINKEFKMSM